MPSCSFIHATHTLNSPKCTDVLFARRQDDDDRSQTQNLDRLTTMVVICEVTEYGVARSNLTITCKTEVGEKKIKKKERREPNNVFNLLLR